MEKSYSEMSIVELKACVYDLLVEREKNISLAQQLSQLIEQKNCEAQVKEPG